MTSCHQGVGDHDLLPPGEGDFRNPSCSDPGTLIRALPGLPIAPPCSDPGTLIRAVPGFDHRSAFFTRLAHCRPHLRSGRIVV